MSLLDIQRLLVLASALAALVSMVARRQARRQWTIVAITCLWAWEWASRPFVHWSPGAYMAWETSIAALAIVHALRVNERRLSEWVLAAALCLLFVAGAEGILLRPCAAFYRPAALVDLAAVVLLVAVALEGGDALTVSWTWGLGLATSLQAAHAMAWEWGPRIVYAVSAGHAMACCVALLLVTRAALASPSRPPAP